MPAVKIEDLICRDCGNRGVLIADQFGGCIACGGRNVVPTSTLPEEEIERLQEM